MAKRLEFKSTTEMTRALIAEAKRMGMSLDELVRVENLPRSKVLRAAIRFHEAQMEKVEESALKKNAPS